MRTHSSFPHQPTSAFVRQTPDRLSGGQHLVQEYLCSEYFQGLILWIFPPVCLREAGMWVHTIYMQDRDSLGSLKHIRDSLPHAASAGAGQACCGFH